jgi:hypothetical protein
LVEEPPRGCDHDLHAGAQRALLGAGGDAAEHGDGADPGVAPEGLEVLVHLGGELPGRGHHQGAGAASRAGDEALQDGQDEGGDLSAAGHGTGQHVAAVKPRGQRRDLNGCGRREAQVGDPALENGIEVELGE